MQMRRIGSLEVSAVAVGGHDLGTRIGDEQTESVVLGALDAGINFFDTAEAYGRGRSEESLGKALRNRRDDAILATKYDGPPSEARAHVEASLRRLGQECIDLYTLHHPVEGVPLADHVAVFAALVDEGKIREFGSSNLDLDRLREAIELGAPGAGGFASLQNDYNLFNRKMEFEIIPACLASGIAFTAYFPLYHGFLSGKFARSAPLPAGMLLTDASEQRKAAIFTDEHFDVIEALAAFAATSGHSVLELSLARLLAEPGVAAVLPGASWPEEARENAAAADWILSAEEIAAIDEIVPARRDSPNTPSAANGFP